MKGGEGVHRAAVCGVADAGVLRGEPLRRCVHQRRPAALLTQFGVDGVPAARPLCTVGEDEPGEHGGEERDRETGLHVGESVHSFSMGSAATCAERGFPPTLRWLAATVLAGACSSPLHPWILRRV